MRKKMLWGGGILLLAALLTIFTGACEGPAQPPPTIPGPQGEQSDIDVTMSVSKPSNGQFFTAGEKPVITVTLKDASGAALARADFSSLGLYMYGPQEPTKTVTAVKLLNASADRSKSPHHYIELAKDQNVEVKDNVLKYTLQPVTDEEPGTYTVTLRANLQADPLQQDFEVVDVQIGTATVEAQIVEREKCAACHLGTDSGQFYFHHVDPGRSPTGSPAIDSWPVKTCKSCHNNDGYAAYPDPTTKERIPDPIVNRVHGVHNGSHLESLLNIGSQEANIAGIFGNYLHVEFPANVKNCTTCHVDDRWKTEPNRVACGACHDNTWFGDLAAKPETMEAHPGGPQTNDANCSTCHTPDSGGMAPPISVAHKVEPPNVKQLVELAMTPPANGKFYVAGEAPKVTITIKDAATGAIINPNTIVEPADPQNVQANEWRRANLYVSGPRKQTKPVLTTIATHDEYDHSYANNDFRVRVNPDAEDPKVSRSETSITYQLGNVAALTPGTYTAFVEIMAAPVGAWDVMNFQVGTATEDPLVATNCTSCHANDVRMHSSYFAVQFNPDICKNCHDYERQMSGKSGWAQSNNGFGAAPLARRVHGVHFGHYLDKPEEVHRTRDYSHTIFPQDVRNCTKCHDPAGSPAWKEQPSRLACNACHDSDEALAHTGLMTSDPTPAEPFSGDEIEPCAGCHGAGTALSPDKVHNISDPYIPPYPREHTPGD